MFVVNFSDFEPNTPGGMVACEIQSALNMKIFFGFARFAGGYRSAKGIVFFLAVLGLATGCGHKTEQSASSTTVSQSNSVTAPQSGDAAPVSQQASSPAGRPMLPPVAAPPPTNGQPDLSELNRAIRRWLIANRRAPKNFDDFAATAGVSIPPAPPGKKYILSQNMHVQLVDQ